MISALCVKNFRIWRIFRSELKLQQIKDIELLVLWLVCMIPAVFILVLWTIVSTPTADVQERNGEDHYVCTTGGFTEEPGDYVFFALLTAYGTILLLLGAILSIVIRKVPSLFNESKLLAISIYNLAFLCVVIIPVFLVVHPFNPYIAWILRSTAIVYAFTATMVLQFAFPVFRIIITDRFQDPEITFMSFSSKTSTNAESDSTR